MSAIGSSPYTMMAGLGVNGTAGVKGGSATADWPQILSGYGGPVAMRHNQPRKLVYKREFGRRDLRLFAIGCCARPSDFGTSPAVNDADVSHDG